MADGLLREDGGKLLTEDGGSILLAPVVVIPPPQHVARTVPRRIPKLQFRRGNTAEWATANPVLAQGEPGVDLDTGDFKIGDGATAWNSLPLPYAPLSFQTSAPRGVVATDTAYYSGAAYTFLFTANGLMELRIRTSTYGNVMTIYGRDYYIEDIGAL